MLEEQLAGLRLGMFIIRNDSLIFISAGAFSGFPLCLHHRLHDCDCWERGKRDVGRDEGKAPELERAEKQHIPSAGTVCLGEAEAAPSSFGAPPPLVVCLGAGALPMAKDLPIFWGPVSLSLQVGEGHLSLVLAPRCCEIILFPSSLSLNKMMLLQSPSVCVQGTEVF